MTQPERFGRYSRVIRAHREGLEALGNVASKMIDERNAEIERLRSLLRRAQQEITLLADYGSSGTALVQEISAAIPNGDGGTEAK